MTESTQQPVAVDPILGQMKNNWGWLFGLGVIFLILGFIGLGMTFGLTMVSILFFGVLLVIGGVVQFLNTFQCKQWKGALWHVLIAILYIVAGIEIIYDPVLASTIITALLAITLIAIGISRFVMSLMLREKEGWVWLMLGGIATFLIGLIVLLNWPVSGFWFIGLLIAIEMIINGWTYIFVALAARNA